MKPFVTKICFAILLPCLLFGTFMNSAYARRATNKDKILIGAGSLLEGYYAIGLKTCRYITKSSGVSCEVIPTSGSIENLRLLQRGEIDFAFTLSNLAIDAYSGKGYFINSEPFDSMYQVLRLHDEIFTVLVKDEDRIMTFKDLDGRRISNGPPKSDSSVLYNALEAFYDFRKNPVDIELAHEDYASQFCAGKIDAIMMMAGHPSALVNFITNSCESDFLTLDSEQVDLLLKNNHGFHKATLPAGKYPGITKDEDTIGVNSILVSAGHVDSEIVQKFLELFPKIVDRYKSSHPALYDINNNDFTTDFVLPGLKIKENN